MSVRIDDALDVLSLIREQYITAQAPLKAIRLRALQAVAKARGVTRNDIADIYIRRLRPYVSSTAEFDRVVHAWLLGRHVELKATLEKCSLDQNDMGRIKAFFEADALRITR